MKPLKPTHGPPGRGGGAGLPGVWLSLARNAKNAGRQELAERAFGTVQRIESELSEKTGEQTKNQVIAAPEEEIATLKTPAEKSDAHNQERQTFIETKAKAEKGDFQSQKGLVWMYHYGAGTSEDDAESFRWSLKLAAQGDAEEQCNVGDCYRQGKGVVKNYVEAMKWFLKAAEQGSVNGQELVGDMYSEGEGVAENHANAFNWILKAALNWQEGREMCQVRRKIADAFYKGDGVPKDLIEAYAWFSVVAERVKYKYQEALSVLDPAKHPPAAQMRDKLEKSFTAKEIALAQARALELSAQVSAIDKEGATKAKRP